MSELKVLKATNYLNIQGWKVTELQLKGNQLLIYAVIYGFSQDEEGWFHGSRAYIAEWCSIDQRNVTSNLAKLVNDGLILKDARNEDTGLCNRYRVNPDRLGFLNNCPERPKGMGLQEEEGTEESEQPSAKDGNIALDMMTSSPEGYYDLIFMDMQMPVMDGCTAAKAIRELPRKDVKRMPIIAMTANAFADDRQKTKEAGMNEHLAKPVDMEQLHQVLHKWLSKK